MEEGDYVRQYFFLICFILLFACSFGAVLYSYEYPKVDMQVNTNGSLRYFNDLGELVEFVSTDLTNETKYSRDYDCDNFCFDFQKSAFENGYIVNVQAITPIEYEKYFKEKISGFHIICSTIAGNSFYYIEVQNDTIKRVTIID